MTHEMALILVRSDQMPVQRYFDLCREHGWVADASAGVEPDALAELRRERDDYKAKWEAAAQAALTRQKAIDAGAEKAKRICQWLRGQANAEKDQKARAVFIEAHNAVLAIIEGRA